MNYYWAQNQRRDEIGDRKYTPIETVNFLFFENWDALHPVTSVPCDQCDD